VSGLYVIRNQLNRKTSGIPSDSSSDTDLDSDSESESSGPKDDVTSPEKTFQDEACDEEDSGPQITTATYFQTKNELSDVEIAIPTIEEVGPEEVLEKVGEIMSVVGNVVIVKGMAATSGASERALDSDTLLVFEDRKVLGYVGVLD
jgi:H/ACA ribonucleoprotein complex non-core subunit NAF1